MKGEFNIGKRLDREAGTVAFDPNSASGAPFIEVDRDGWDLRVLAGYTYSHHSAEIKDYPLGKYVPDDAPSAGNVLRIFREALQEDLPKVLENRALTVVVLGTADGVPLRLNATYDGELGILNVPYYSRNSGQRRQLTLSPGTPLLENEHIAVLRAYGVWTRLADLRALQSAGLGIVTETSDRVGGEYRRAVVSVRVHDHYRPHER